MPAIIRAQLAQQIVDTLKTICHHDINYIDIEGRVIASTDPDRVGGYHTGGHEAARTGRMVAIEGDDRQQEVRHGINMPIRFNGSTVAVIGITGIPAEVERYADLAQRITLLLLREHEIDSRNYNIRTQTGYLVRALIDRENVAPAFIAEVLEKNGLTNKPDEWRTIVIQLQDEHPHPLSAIEAGVREVMKQCGKCLFGYRFPHEFVLLIRESDSARWVNSLRQLADEWKTDIRTGVGSKRSLSRQDLSFQAAKLAVQSLEVGENFALYESMRLEILLGSVSKAAADAYLQKCLSGLDEADKNLLNLYFACELSLKETAKKCFLHVNTVQYQLKRIRERSGLDPRRFREASLLYTALRVEAMTSRSMSGSADDSYS